jgi:hypothetical protein
MPIVAFVPIALIAGAGIILMRVVHKARKRDAEFLKRVEARQAELRG